MKRTAACLSAFAAAIFFSFPVLAGPASETGTAADGSGQKTQQVQDNPNFATVKDQEGTVTLIAAGDDLIHANIYRRAFRPETGTYDFHSLYEPVKDVISSYDLAVINQETILVDNPAMYSSYPAFGTPQEIGEALADTGFVQCLDCCCRCRLWLVRDQDTSRKDLIHCHINNGSDFI